MHSVFDGCTCNDCRAQITDSVPTGATSTPAPASTATAEPTRGSDDGLPGHETCPPVDAATRSAEATAPMVASPDGRHRASGEATTTVAYLEPLGRVEDSPYAIPGFEANHWTPPEPVGVTVAPGPGRGVTVTLDDEQARVLHTVLANADARHMAGVTVVAGYDYALWTRARVDLLLALSRHGRVGIAVGVPVLSAHDLAFADPADADTPSAEEPRP